MALRPAKRRQTSKRAALIEAAKALLWERGYEAMSPGAIQQASGAGQGSFYHHFESKRDLATQALAAALEDLRQEFDGGFPAHLAPLARIEHFLSQPRDALKGCRAGRLANERAIAEPALRAPVADYFSHVGGALEAALEEARRAGDLPIGVDSRALATTFLAAIQGGFVLSRAQGDATHMTRALAGARALLRALASRPGEAAAS